MKTMKTISLKYPTVTKQRRIGDKLYVVETIRDMDEAINILCDALAPHEQVDPFAEHLCPYFGVLWPASQALSQYLLENVHLIKGKRVLELGCGLGLPSLVATHLGASALATDYHPDVEEYFLRNCRHSSLECAYQRVNWREGNNLIGEFDVVIGSDILYEPKHSNEVADGLRKFVKPGGTIILADAGRPHLKPFLNVMNSEGLKEEKSLIHVEDKDILLFKFSL